MFCKRNSPKRRVDLNVSSFFDGMDEFELQSDAVGPEVNTWDGTDDNINLLDRIHKAFVIGKGGFNKMSTLFLEGEQHLKLFNLKAQLGALNHICLMPLCQTCPHYPPPYVPCSPHHKNLAFPHFFSSKVLFNKWLFTLLCCCCC